MVPDPRDLVETAAEWIVRAIGWALETSGAGVQAEGHCTLALAGGGTPRPVYRRLSEHPLVGRVPWDRLEIFFSDERGVPPTDPNSNYRMASDALFQRAPIPGEQVHRMEAERADLEGAAREYAGMLPEALDVLLLGMGADGHTASLFPHHAALRERARRVVAVTEGVPLAPRLTITPPVIDRAKRVMVLVSGLDKAAAVARALDGPDQPEVFPIQLARHRMWILDRAAASALRNSTV